MHNNDSRFSPVKCFKAFWGRNFTSSQVWCLKVWAGNTKGGSITVLLTSCLTGLETAVWQLTIFLFICKTYLSKPVKQEVNGTVILLPPLVFPGLGYHLLRQYYDCYSRVNWGQNIEISDYDRSLKLELRRKKKF